MSLQWAVRVVMLLGAAYVAMGVLLYLGRNRIVFPMRGGPAGSPQRFGFPTGQSVTLRTADGARLTGWLLPPPESTPAPWPVLLWFHGNGETVAGLAGVLRTFQPPHAALLALDYRGYGTSTGQATVANTVQDAEAAFAWIRTRAALDSERVVVYGRSAGSGPAVALAATHHLAGLVLESAFTSLGAMARVHFRLFPAFLAGQGFDNLGTIGRVACPVLFIHGGQDRTIPIAMGRALAARTPMQDELVVIPQARHNDTYDVGGARYAQKLRQFFDRMTAVRR